MYVYNKLYKEASIRGETPIQRVYHPEDPCFQAP